MEAVVSKGRSVTWKGETYLPGKKIPDLPEAEVERLIKKGVMEIPEPEEEEKAPKKPEKKKPEKKGSKKDEDPENDSGKGGGGDAKE
jgi:hypothetical protein